jgi:hypothetical protein
MTRRRFTYISFMYILWYVSHSHVHTFITFWCFVSLSMTFVGSPTYHIYFLIYITYVFDTSHTQTHTH